MIKVRKLVEQLEPIKNKNSNIGYLIYFKGNAEWYDSTIIPEINKALKRNNFRSAPSGYILSVDNIEEAIQAINKVNPFSTFEEAEKIAKILKRLMEDEDTSFDNIYYYTIVKCYVEKVSILRLEELEIENEN